MRQSSALLVTQLSCNRRGSRHRIVCMRDRASEDDQVSTRFERFTRRCCARLFMARRAFWAYAGYGGEQARPVQLRFVHIACRAHDAIAIALERGLNAFTEDVRRRFRVARQHGYCERKWLRSTSVGGALLQPFHTRTQHAHAPLRVQVQVLRTQRADDA